MGYCKFVVKMSIIPKEISRLFAVPIKITLFYKNRKIDNKIYMEPQKTQSSQNGLEKEEPSWMDHISGFQNILQSQNR